MLSLTFTSHIIVNARCSYTCEYPLSHESGVVLSACDDVM